MKATFKMTLELEITVDNGKSIFDTTTNDLYLLKGDTLTAILDYLKKYKTCDKINESFTIPNLINGIKACCSESKITI